MNGKWLHLNILNNSHKQQWNQMRPHWSKLLWLRLCNHVWAGSHSSPNTRTLSTSPCAGEAPVRHYWSKMDLQRPNTSVHQRSLHWSDCSAWSFRHPGYCFHLIVPPSPRVPTPHQPGGARSLPRSVSAPEMWRASDFSSLRQETWKKHISFPLMFYNLEYSLGQLNIV